MVPGGAHSSIFCVHPPRRLWNSRRRVSLISTKVAICPASWMSTLTKWTGAHFVTCNPSSGRVRLTLTQNIKAIINQRLGWILFTWINLNVHTLHLIQSTLLSLKTKRQEGQTCEHNHLELFRWQINYQMSSILQQNNEQTCTDSSVL